jgi:hypothetical protein
MSYKTLVLAQIENAFNIAGDLAVDAQLIRTAQGEFDFSSGDVTLGTPFQTNIKFVEIEGSKSSAEGNSYTRKIILRRPVFGVSALDTISVPAENKVYSISPEMEINDYYVILNIFLKEGPEP